MHHLGAHVSIAGGVDKAVDRAVALGADALQIFVKSAGQWAARPLAEKEVERFRHAVQSAGLGPYVVTHASYLINSASPDPALRDRSREALIIELQRCSLLGIQHLVLHPGSHVGEGVESGLARVSEQLDEVFEDPRSKPADRSGTKTKILLETTAGQGTNLGSRFEDLANIIEQSRYPDRLDVCFDTCHVFAAGYDLREEESYRRTFNEFDRVIGLDRLKAFHLNDSKFSLGSRRDRHADIGAGEIGCETFRLLINDIRFQSLPMILETPKGADGGGHRRNLAVMRKFAN